MITQAIDEAVGALATVAPDYEIIVVDDGSTDATAAIVNSIARRNPRVHLLRHELNQGYGAALRNGFAAATKDLVAFTDADCQFDLAELDRFLLLAKSYDVVCGYRIDRQDTKLRCLYSLIYNWIVRIVLGIRVRDVDCALKVFRGDLLRKTGIRSDGFLINSDLLTQVRELGGSIVEVGVTHRARPAGQSTVSIRHIPRVLASLARYWWNEVQFGGCDHTRMTSAEFGKNRRLGWIQLVLVVMTGVFLLSNLGYPLIDRDETRYAEIPREMLVSGDWILPTLNFKTYYDKPPLLYWLVASSFSVFGVHEWSARLVPAIAALGTLLLVIWFANRHLGRRIGLISGGVLMLTGGFAFSSRYLLLDGVLTFLTTASLFAAYEAFNSSKGCQFRWGWWTAASTACGLGCLTKGPLSLVLLLPVILSFAWLQRDVARIRFVQVATLIAIVCGITLPWVIAVSLRDETFLYEFLVNHNVRRFAGHYHERPIWYFVPVLLMAGFPWSFLTIPFIRHLATRSTSVRKSRGAITGFLSLWVVWMFVFFSASRCKLPTYLLPTAPAFALLLGIYIDRLTRNVTSADAWERFARIWSARLATIACGVLGIGLYIYMSHTAKDFGAEVFTLVSFLLVLLVGACLLIRVGSHPQMAWTLASLATIMLLTVALHRLVPAYSRSQSVFAEAQRRNSEFVLDPTVPVATIGHEFSEVPFYLRREDIFNFASQEDPAIVEFANEQSTALLVVRRDILIGELHSHLPPGVRVQSLETRGPARLLRLSKGESLLANLTFELKP